MANVYEPVVLEKKYLYEPGKKMIYAVIKFKIKRNENDKIIRINTPNLQSETDPNLGHCTYVSWLVTGGGTGTDPFEKEVQIPVLKYESTFDVDLARQRIKDDLARKRIGGYLIFSFVEMGEVIVGDQNTSTISGDADIREREEFAAIDDPPDIA